jgi:DnaJ-class molecular chaperone
MPIVEINHPNCPKAIVECEACRGFGQIWFMDEVTIEESVADCLDCNGTGKEERV